MEIDLNIFNYFYSLKNKKRDLKLQNILNSNNAVYLEDLKVKISIFASSIFKENIEVRSTEELPYKSSNIIFLPKFIAVNRIKSNNELCYRLIILHLFAYQILIAKNKNSNVISLRDEVITILSNFFPMYLEGLQSIQDNLITYEQVDLNYIYKSKSNIGFNSEIIWGSLPREKQVLFLNSADGTDTSYPDVKTEKKNKVSGKINKIKLNEDEENIGQDVFHHFEKIETIEEYKGINRETDGEDQLDDHIEALSDINLEEVVRSSKRVQSLYKTEVDLGFEIPDLEKESNNSIDNIFIYDEWDLDKRSYKKNWCTVYHTKIEIDHKKTNSNKFTLKLEKRQSEINRIKKKLLQLSAEIEIKKKLLTGKLIDIDNYIRNQASLNANQYSDGRYYKNIIKRHRDMAIVVLVDCSLSSDSWVNNHRVLDICLESLLIFGEAVDSINDPMLVAGFNSNTRNSCQFIEWKGFNESWHSLKNKIDDIRPDGFTRIGPAIRHAKSLLEKRTEKHKMLIILTDGRPTDYDRYEGTYGLSDVKKSISECEAKGIIPFALAVDPSSKQFLPHLFGNNNYQILNSLEKLPEALTKLYIRISKATK